MKTLTHYTARALILLTAGATLAACSSPAQSTKNTASTQASSAASVATTAAAKNSQSSHDTATTSPEAPRDGDRCTTKNLNITSSSSLGEAGASVLTVLFTNTAQHTCTLAGYPGISLVADRNGSQLGKAAERERGLGEAPVTLRPGASASATVSITKAGAMDPAECQPTPADGLRVYPPNETEAAFVPVGGVKGCRGDVSLLSVQPVIAAR